LKFLSFYFHIFYHGHPKHTVFINFLNICIHFQTLLVCGHPEARQNLWPRQAGKSASHVNSKYKQQIGTVLRESTHEILCLIISISICGLE
jgi:hypothetical protein